MLRTAVPGALAAYETIGIRSAISLAVHRIDGLPHRYTSAQSFVNFPGRFQIYIYIILNVQIIYLYIIYTFKYI